MADLPTPDPALQPCTGQNGEHAPTPAQEWFGEYGIEGYPDARAFMMQAAVGRPCLRSHQRDHADFVLVSLRSFPSARIVTYRDARGRIQKREYGLKRISPERREYLRAAWQLASLTTTPLEGASAKDAEHDAHIIALCAAYQRLKQRHTERTPTYRACLKAIGVKYETSRSILRRAGLSWSMVHGRCEALVMTANTKSQTTPQNEFCTSIYTRTDAR